MGFGQIENVPVFILPGNPVAAFVCFLLYVRPAIQRLSGAKWQNPVRVQVPAGFDIPKKKPDRREFLRGKLETDVSGNTFVNKFQQDGSGLISSLRKTDGLIEIPENTTRIRKGDLVSYISYRELGVV